MKSLMFHVKLMFCGLWIVVCMFWEFMWILGKVIYVLFKYIKGEMFS